MNSTDAIIFVDKQLKEKDFACVIVALFDEIPIDHKDRNGLLQIGLGRIAGFLQIENRLEERERVLDTIDTLATLQSMDVNIESIEEI